MGPGMAAGASPALGTGQPRLRPSAGTTPPGHGTGSGAERRPAAGGTPRPRPAGRHAAAPLSPAPRRTSARSARRLRAPPAEGGGRRADPCRAGGRVAALAPGREGSAGSAVARGPGPSTSRRAAKLGGRPDQTMWSREAARRREHPGPGRRLAGGRRARVPRSEQLAAPPGGSGSGSGSAAGAPSSSWRTQRTSR